MGSSPDELYAFPEPSPVPAWSDPRLHAQADACIAWIRRAMQACGCDEAVFTRREGSAGEMARLIDRLETVMRTARHEVAPGIIWTCRRRLDLAAPERDLWMSALTYAYYVPRPRLSGDGG